ncbi:universal stress protein [Pedobacter sp. ASV28]|uniref:universal stress protein n=1 Tax=Pedobacter sp. ASV28 TaxID=2795123 RepID=UPI0018ECFF6E|nr:universal stress protein [Pedobacter sp. ASV28]
MKKILVPTDFSWPAKNAAIYAMHLAKVMQVNVKLCNVIMVPLEIPIMAQASWPLVEYDTLEEESTQELKMTAKKLEKLFETEAILDSFRPAIDYSIGVGSVPEAINTFASNPVVEMIVMGMSGSGGITQFLLGSSSRTIIETAKIPILLIPKNIRFNGIYKIAFATDLGAKDVELIGQLADFAKKFNAEILLVHIGDEAPEGKHQEKVDHFMKQIGNSVGYAKIDYEYVWNIDINHGLEWFAEHRQVNMLAMVHKKHSVFYRIFNGSHTQHVKDRIKLPLLVIPEFSTKKV